MNNKNTFSLNNKSVEPIARNPGLSTPRVAEHSTRDAEQRSLEGALLSNTAPPNCINPILIEQTDDNFTSVLHSGIDSLYLSFHGKLFFDIEQKLIKCKDLASSTEATQQAKAVLFLEEHQFTVNPKGKGNFAYVIQDNWFHISLSKSSTTQMPMAYVQVRSELLNRGDLDKIIIALEYLISLFGDIRISPTVSRVDLKSDFLTSYDLKLFTEDYWVSRSNNFNYYSQNKIFSGYVMGKGGDLSCRLYNKTLAQILR